MSEGFGILSRGGFVGGVMSSKRVRSLRLVGFLFGGDGFVQGIIFRPTSLLTPCIVAHERGKICYDKRCRFYAEVRARRMTRRCSWMSTSSNHPAKPHRSLATASPSPTSNGFPRLRTYPSATFVPS